MLNRTQQSVLEILVNVDGVTFSEALEIIYSLTTEKEQPHDILLKTARILFRHRHRLSRSAHDRP